jgi:PAS domain S-box-containing protein
MAVFWSFLERELTPQNGGFSNVTSLRLSFVRVGDTCPEYARPESAASRARTTSIDTQRVFRYRPFGRLLSRGMVEILCPQGRTSPKKGPGSKGGRACAHEMPYDWLSTTPQAGVITDADGIVLALNEAFRDLFAVVDTCLPEEPLEDLIIVSRCRAAYRAARRLVLAAGPSMPAEPTRDFVALRADGGEFAAQLTFTRIDDDTPHLATWVRDLTEDRTVVTQTSCRETLYERAEELAGFGSWEWTPRRISWSDNLFRIYGLRPGEIIPSAEHVFAHCHPDDRERLERAHHARAGRRLELGYRYVRSDGTVRHLRSTVVSAAKERGGSQRLIGTVQDVTDEHQAQLELAARFVVSDALSEWRPGAPGALRLVRDLAEALEFDVGAMWIPRDEALLAWVVWQARASRSPERESTLRGLRLGRGDCLAGSGWATGEPTRLADLTDDASDAVRALDLRTGMHGSLALPATYGDEVLAVFTFASRHQAVITDQFSRSLVGIGLEIGHFLARRRSELSAAVLTSREVEVLQLSATGHARRQIANEMELSEATVKTHLEHIYKKLGVPDRASAVGEALRQGLIH